MIHGEPRNPLRNRKSGTGHSSPKDARARFLSRHPHAAFGWRGLETESRLGLHGHERGNPGYRQDQNLTDHRASPRPYWGFDRRFGPKTPPRNKLSPAERKKVLDAANRPEHVDLSPKQIVPRLADDGIYLASESTFYRVLHEEDALQHREPSRLRSVARPREYVATGPLEIWSWDITYLRSAVRGGFYLD